MRIGSRTCSRLLALAAAFVSAAACTYDRRLLITEVGAGAIELYLDETPDKHLDLSGITLRLAVNDPAGGAPIETVVRLVGELDGEQFIVVFEEPGHVGGPATETYTNFFNENMLGIAVAPGTLGPVDAARSYAMRVDGEHTIYVFPFFFADHRVDDVVTFGPRPRPSLGGVFAENGDLDVVDRSPAVQLTPGRTIRRRVLNGEVRDSDQERNWRDDGESFGRLE